MKRLLIAAALAAFTSIGQAQTTGAPVSGIYDSSSGTLIGARNLLTGREEPFSLNTLVGPLSPAKGGTGVANTSTKTITLGGPLVTSGAFTTTLTSTAATNSTLPAGTHSLAPLDSPTFTSPTLGVANATSINFGNSALGAYVEGGTWTPNVGGDATYTAQNGQYIKIGKLACIWGQLKINVIGTGSANTISGLPLQALAGVPYSMSVSYYTGLAINQIFVGGYVNAAAATITLTASAAAGAAISNAPNIMGNATELIFSACYPTVT